MDLGFSRFELVVLVWFASSCLVMPLAHAQGKAQVRRSIELSETNSAQILTNLNLLTNRKETARPLDEQLRSLKGLSSGDTFEDRFSLPYAPPPMLTNKKLKELLERKRNWALTPKEIDLATGNSESDALSGFEQDKNSSKKSLQQFYDALNRPNPANQPGERPGNDRSTARQGQDSFQNNLDDDSSLPPGLRDKTRQLQKFVTEDPGSVFNPAAQVHATFDNFDNFFGLSDATKPDQNQNFSSKTPGDSFLDRFKKGLDASSALGLNPALSALLPSSTAPRTSIAADLQNLPSTLHREMAQPTPGLVSTVPDPTSLSDANATVLNQWNPLYVPPKLELPKVTSTPLTPLNFEYPRRRF